MTSRMIVQGVAGRPTYDPYGKLIPIEYAVVVPTTPTMIRAVRSGDLLEFERAVSAEPVVETKEDVVVVEEIVSEPPADETKDSSSSDTKKRK